MVLYNVPRQVFSSADGMIVDFCNQIHHPFTAGPLLASPLQEIDVTDLVIQPLLIILIGDQKRLFEHQIIVGRWVMVL